MIKKIILIFFSIFLSSCSHVTVYKIANESAPGLVNEFHNAPCFLIEGSRQGDSLISKKIKDKIEIYLKSQGFCVITKVEDELPRFIMIFDWNFDKKSKETTISIYEPGETIYTSGNVYGYNCDNYSYSGSSRTSGSIKKIPYTYITYDASLTICVFDRTEDRKSESCTPIPTWSTRSFLFQDEYIDIDVAMSYLIVTAFERFGSATDGADKYQFRGNESELNILNDYDNQKNKITKRRLASTQK